MLPAFIFIGARVGLVRVLLLLLMGSHFGCGTANGVNVVHITVNAV